MTSRDASAHPLYGLLVKPKTGRTHQIRVHMAARGWPIVGDPVYSAPDEAVPRLALHAWRVTMPHPETRELLEIEAPLPDDLKRLIDQNRTL